ncbi:hypothetical protein [Streptomyces showdoensis]|uniref:Uncharacterized protein n=1 Tax=Streptomyces showdoensis TaxID=68268 RepID=A0A2P2GQB0_STREW|nr:hypothetical protein [Streptomyces showdoensis]KKZ73694.1 hypothetical protein VO63_11255 [Streptomyces showdoensis]
MTTHSPTRTRIPRKHGRARRLTSVVAALLFMLGVSVAFTGQASATVTACATFGCDGHNPNIQTWQWGPTTAPGGAPHPRGAIELRVGKTDGDQYAWARGTYPTGAGGAYVYVDRQNRGGGGYEGGLGRHEVGESGWYTMSGTNTMSGWSGMYYNPTYKQVRACIYLYAGGETYCSGWY